MGTFNIPQFIETEDKIAGPFTAKQLGWIIAAAAILFVAYLLLGKTAMFILALPVLGIFGGLAFYKPNGQPLTFLFSAIVRFFLGPKLYVWKRQPEERASARKAPPKKAEATPEKKIITRDKIDEISRLLNNSK